MKKTILLILAALMLVGLLASCVQKQYINIVDVQKYYDTEFFIVTGMTWQQFIDENSNIRYEDNVLQCQFTSPSISDYFYDVYIYNDDPTHVYQSSERAMNLDLDSPIEDSWVLAARIMNP